MTTYLPAAVICTTMALTSRIDTDAIVNISLKHEAEELVGLKRPAPLS